MWWNNRESWWWNNSCTQPNKNHGHLYHLRSWQLQFLSGDLVTSVDARKLSEISNYLQFWNGCHRSRKAGTSSFIKHLFWVIFLCTVFTHTHTVSQTQLCLRKNVTLYSCLFRFALNRYQAFVQNLEAWRIAVFWRFCTNAWWWFSVNRNMQLYNVLFFFK